MRIGEGSAQAGLPETGSAALTDEEAARLCVSLVELRDGRVFVGVLKSFDHFGNLVVEHASERFIARAVPYEVAPARTHVFAAVYADLFLGCMLIRGENVALFGRDESTLLRTYLEDLEAAAEKPKAFAAALRMRAIEALRTGRALVQLPLALVLSAKDEAAESRQHAQQVWAEYSRRLQSLGKGKTMEESFIESMLINAGKANGQFLDSELSIVRALFAKYVANATAALSALGEDERDLGVDECG